MSDKKALRLLIGGSPCTYWSVAQKKNRETKAEGLGWELFNNFLIAKEKFKPDLFLYENNKSASQEIKDQIVEELGCPLQIIDIALVSAQKRLRFYVHNWECPQPQDRGIVLKDILESGSPFGQTANEKSYCLTARYYKGVGTSPNRVLERNIDTMVAEPIRIGSIGSESQAHRVYSCEGKSVTIKSQAGGQGAKTGLYACPATGKEEIVYEVKDGEIFIKDKKYPIKLSDGLYCIRKLTPVECERLQTLPDGYTKSVSNTQRYKGLGNGWTAEVIIHQLKYGLKDVPKDYPIEVLSMYDGIGTGRYCLDKLGFTNVTYKAYEIDKYAITVAKDNYPDIIECGDAFQVREENWSY